MQVLNSLNNCKSEIGFHRLWAGITVLFTWKLLPWSNFLQSYGDTDKLLQMFIVEYFCSKKILLESLLKLGWNLTVLSVNSKSFIKERKLVGYFCLFVCFVGFCLFVCFCKNQLVLCSVPSLRKVFQGFHFHKKIFIYLFSVTRSWSWTI